jgi:beta-aspartyl-dipeptidase (metallo-type)
LGVKDVLIAGGRVIAVADSLNSDAVAALDGAAILNATGLLVIPGLVDIHAHLAGGGGELGEISRTPEARLSEILDAGITTAVGVLGTDGVGRSLAGLHAKAAALASEGLSTYTWSGSYRCCPPLSLTGDVARDVQLLPGVLGAGEVAISDHRSSWPSPAQLATLAADIRVAGLLSGKKGVTHLHVGSAPTGLELLRAAVDATRGALPADHFLPTHCSNRGETLLREAISWVQDYRGHVDFTADAVGAHRNDTIDALLQWAEADLRRQSAGETLKNPKVLLDSVSVSTDAFGSFPEFDEEGQLVSYSVSSPNSLLHLLRALTLDHGWSLAKVAAPFLGTAIRLCCSTVL